VSQHAPIIEPETEIDLEKREQIVEFVTTDSNSGHREVTIRGSKDSERLNIYSSRSPFTRRMLCHDLSEVESLTVKNGTSYSEKTVDEVLAMDDEPDIIAVDFTIPTGVLNISETARNSDSLSYVPPEQ
jgi:hypothetical protein